MWQAGRYAIPYLDAKHEAESAALRLVSRGAAVVIVNPAHVLGAGDPGRSSTALVRRFLRRADPRLRRRDAEHRRRSQDVARGHLLADERGRVGERYILGNRNFTMTGCSPTSAGCPGCEPPAMKLPVTVALALAGDGPAARRDAAAHAGRGARRVAELELLQPQGQA